MPSARLWGEAFAPWTLRAKWALQHAQYPYENVEYVPGGADVWVLRLALRRWRVTVPVIFTPERRAVTDSFEIAQLADGARPDGVAPLTAHEGVEAWVRDCEERLCTQRSAPRPCSSLCVTKCSLPRGTHGASQRVCTAQNYGSARARLRLRAAQAARGATCCLRCLQRAILRRQGMHYRKSSTRCNCTNAIPSPTRERVQGAHAAAHARRRCVARRHVPSRLRWLGAWGVALVRAVVRGMLGKYPHSDDIRHFAARAREGAGAAEGADAGAPAWAVHVCWCVALMTCLHHGSLLQGSVSKSHLQGA
jgi:Glutathione S-transferase, N-terminal domain